MNTLPRWTGDGELSAALNLLASAIESVSDRRISGGPGIRVAVDATGARLTATRAGAASGAAGSPDHPFKIVDASDATPKVRIVYGSVNGVGATTGDNANDGTGPPGTPTLTLASGLNNLYVEGVWSAGEEPLTFASAAVRVGATSEGSDHTCAFAIGSVFVGPGNALTINQGVTGSLTCFRLKCGSALPLYQWEGV